MEHDNDNSNDKIDSGEESSSSSSDDEEYSYNTRRRGKYGKSEDLNGEVSGHKTYKQRVFGQPCLDCKMACDTRMNDRFRQDNYLYFWGKLKTWEDRRTYLRRLVQVLRIPHLTNKTRKKFLRKYYLEMEDGYILVCKTMFFSTLAISAKFLETTLQKYPDNVLDESEIKLVNSPTIIPKSLDTSKTKVYKKIANMPKDEVEEESSAADPEEVPLEGQLLDTQHKEEIKPACDCSEKCAEKVPEEMRLKIYEHFWLKLQSWEERKLFIINTVERDRYTSLRTFLLPMKDGGHITVCQEMYLNTMSLSEKSIDLILPKMEPIRVLKRKSNIDYLEQFAAVSPAVTINKLSSVNVEHPKEIAKDVQPPLPPMKRIKLESIPLKPPCSCDLKCRLKLTEDIRQQIHREFWNLPAQVDQKHFILSTLQVQIHKDKLTKEKTHEIKYFMLPFHYDSTIVCKEMYLHTLTVSEEFVSRTIKSINQDGSIIEDDQPDTNKNVQASVKNVTNGAGPLNQPNSELLDPEVVQVRRVKRSRNSKRMGPPCPDSCRLRCNTKFTNDQRTELHQQFWYKMDWQGRQQFVMNTVKEFPIKNRSIPGRLTKRNFSRIYTLPLKDNKITVCQKMYFNTLSICSKFVSTVHIWASQVKW